MSSTMRCRTVAGLPVVTVLAIVLHQFTDPVSGQIGSEVGTVSAPGVTAISAAPSVPLHSPHLPQPGPPPINADGHPDLNGMWDYATSTPMQRSPDFEETLFLDAEEASTLRADRLAARNTDLETPGTLLSETEEGIEIEDVARDAYNKGMNNVWFDNTAPLVQDRTSLIVDPPNGRIPPLTPEAEERMERCSGIGYCGPQMQSPRDAYHPPADETIANHITDRSLTERCMVVRNGPPMESTAWNNNIHILHREDYVVLHTEMIHTARMVWLDGRPRPDPSVKLWHGYSRGHWEGDTLVVETTNFRPDATWLGVLNREAFTLVERFTRTDADTVMYEYTMNAPETWTQPWTVQLPMKRLDGMMYEYACHEGNYGVKFQLMAARSKEK